MSNVPRSPAEPVVIGLQTISCLLPRRLIKRVLLLLICWFFLSQSLAIGQEVIDLGSLSREKIDRLLGQAGQIPDLGDKSRFISAAFLKTPYRAATLVGSDERAEIFVIRLDGVDCFTLLDYVEALRRSSDFVEFKDTLRRVRYRNGQVAFLQRNHFFSEWATANSAWLRDITSFVGGAGVRQVEKYLNRKAVGGLYLPGYPVKRTKINYIPAITVDETLLARLKTGDYIGIYSPLVGLDVSHCGMVVIKGGKVFLRHASSISTRRKVVDQELVSYLNGTKGIVVYRPIDHKY